MQSPMARPALLRTTSSSWTPDASEKIRPPSPVASSSNSRMQFATSPFSGPITARVNSMEGKENARSTIPAIVVRLATEESTSRHGSVDVTHISQANAHKRKGNRRSFVVSSPSAALVEGVFTARLCMSPEPISGATGRRGTLPPAGKGRGGADESKRTAPSSSRTADLLPLRGDARSKPSAGSPPQGATQSSARTGDVNPAARDAESYPRSSPHTRGPHTPFHSPVAGAVTPRHTQSPASAKSRGRSPSLKNVGTSQAIPHTPKGGLPARVAALRQTPVEAHPHTGLSRKDSRIPGSAEERSLPERPLTPLSLPVMPSDFLAVPLSSPSGSRKAARSISPRWRKAYQPSLQSHYATESETSSFRSPFSRSTKHASDTSRSSAGSPSVYGPPPDWITGPSLLKPPCRAFTKGSAPPIESRTLRRRVCTSTVRTDPGLNTVQQVKDGKESLAFSSPTKEEKRRGRAGGKVDPLNGHYVYAYDPESPPRHSRAVRELGVPEPLESGDVSVEWEGDVTSMESTFARSATPDSPRFSPLTRNSPQYVEVQRMGSFSLFSRRRPEKRLQVDTNDSSWPLVDFQHWDMAEVSVMTQEDHLKREQRVEDHTPCPFGKAAGSAVEWDRIPPQAPVNASTTTENTTGRKRRLYVANPDERDGPNDTKITTNYDDRPIHEPTTISAPKRDDDTRPTPMDRSHWQRTPHARGPINQERVTATMQNTENRGLHAADPDKRDDPDETTKDERPTHEPTTSIPQKTEINTRPKQRNQSLRTDDYATAQARDRKKRKPHAERRKSTKTEVTEMTPRHGSWIDEMTMRSLFKLLEQTLKESQKRFARDVEVKGMLNELQGCVQRHRSWAKKRECYLCPVGRLSEKRDIRVAWRLKSLFWYLHSGESSELRRFGEALDVGPCVAVGKSG